MISAEAFFDEERSVLLSFDKKTICCFFEKYGIEAPDDENSLWYCVCRRIYDMGNVPQDTKNKAERWLREHGYLQTFGSRRR